MEFLYDHTGVFAVKNNDATYFYRKNAQNDIIALLDNMGNVVVKYVYDAWGNCKVLDTLGDEITDKTHIGILNPFRYRSYYFDVETNLYFLKTRYYAPEIGRFMTIDDLSYLDPDTVNGLNLYAYCRNNPIKYIDPNGRVAITTILAIIGICALVGAVSGAAISGATYAMTTDNFVALDFWASVAGGAVSGGLMGALAGAFYVYGVGATMVVVLSAIGGAVSNAIGSVAEGLINGDLTENPFGYAVTEIVPSAIWGAAFGALFGLMSGVSPSAKHLAEVAGRTLENQLIKILKYKVIKKIGPMLIENIISDFTTWYTETVIDSFYKKVFS